MARTFLFSLLCSWIAFCLWAPIQAISPLPQQKRLAKRLRGYDEYGGSSEFRIYERRRTPHSSSSKRVRVEVLHSAPAPAADVPKASRIEKVTNDASLYAPAAAAPKAPLIERVTKDVSLDSKPIVLSGNVSGGLGNQIEVLLQLLGLASRNSFELSFPRVTTRFNRSTLDPSNVWDISAMKSLVQNIYSERPNECNSDKNGKLYIFRAEERQLGKEGRARCWQYD